MDVLDFLLWPIAETAFTVVDVHGDMIRFTFPKTTLLLLLVIAIPDLSTCAKYINNRRWKQK